MNFDNIDYENMDYDGIIEMLKRMLIDAEQDYKENKERLYRLIERTKHAKQLRMLAEEKKREDHPKGEIFKYVSYSWRSDEERWQVRTLQSSCGSQEYICETEEKEDARDIALRIEKAISVFAKYRLGE